MFDFLIRAWFENKEKKTKSAFLHLKENQVKERVNDIRSFCSTCWDSIDMLCGPESYDFVTKSELMKFKRDIWPRLYAEWEESEKKRKAEMRAKNANDSKKIRAKIARLQKKLDSIEN